MTLHSFQQGHSGIAGGLRDRQTCCALNWLSCQHAVHVDSSSQVTCRPRSHMCRQVCRQHVLSQASCQVPLPWTSFAKNSHTEVAWGNSLTAVPCNRYRLYNAACIYAATDHQDVAAPCYIAALLFAMQGCYIARCCNALMICCQWGSVLQYIKIHAGAVPNSKWGHFEASELLWRPKNLLMGSLENPT